MPLHQPRNQWQAAFTVNTHMRNIRLGMYRLSVIVKNLCQNVFQPIFGQPFSPLLFIICFCPKLDQCDIKTAVKIQSFQMQSGSLMQNRLPIGRQSAVGDAGDKLFALTDKGILPKLCHLHPRKPGVLFLRSSSRPLENAKKFLRVSRL